MASSPSAVATAVSEAVDDEGEGGEGEQHCIVEWPRLQDVLAVASLEGLVTSTGDCCHSWPCAEWAAKTTSQLDASHP
eukprot:4616112-Amphidinium_carterae.1